MDADAFIEKENKMNYKEVGTCSICGTTYGHWGNNAQPVNDGRCCDQCNSQYVIPARLGIMVDKPKEK